MAEFEFDTGPRVFGVEVGDGNFGLRGGDPFGTIARVAKQCHVQARAAASAAEARWAFEAGEIAAKAEKQRALERKNAGERQF